MRAWGLEFEGDEVEGADGLDELAEVPGEGGGWGEGFVFEMGLGVEVGGDGGGCFEGGWALAGCLGDFFALGEGGGGLLGFFRLLLRHGWLIFQIVW